MYNSAVSNKSDTSSKSRTLDYATNDCYLTEYIFSNYSNCCLVKKYLTPTVLKLCTQKTYSAFAMLVKQKLLILFY